MIRALLCTSYVAYILSAVRFMRQSPVSLELLYGIRATMYVSSIILLFVQYGNSKAHRIPIAPFIMMLLLVPFLTLDARLHYVELVVAVSTAVLCLQKAGEKALVSAAKYGVVTVILVALLAKFELIPNAVIEGKKLFDFRIKNCLGFDNPNNSFYFLFSSAYVFFALKKRNALILTSFAMLLMLPEVQNKTYTIVLTILLVLPPIVRKLSCEKLSIWAMFLGSYFVGVVSVLIPNLIFGRILPVLGVSIPILDRITSLRASKLVRYAEHRSLFSLAFGGKPNPGDSFFLFMVESLGLPILMVFFFVSYKAILSLFAEKKVEHAYAIAVMPLLGLMEAPVSGHSLMIVCYFYIVLQAFRPVFVRISAVHEGAHPMRVQKAG